MISLEERKLGKSRNLQCQPCGKKFGVHSIDVIQSCISPFSQVNENLLFLSKGFLYTNIKELLQLSCKNQGIFSIMQLRVRLYADKIVSLIIFYPNGIYTRRANKHSKETDCLFPTSSWFSISIKNGLR